MKLSVKTIRDNTTIDEYTKAKYIYNELTKFESEHLFNIAAIYKAGIIEGKRQDRARRRKSGAGIRMKTILRVCQNYQKDGASND